VIECNDNIGCAAWAKAKKIARRRFVQVIGNGLGKMGGLRLPLAA
jgi:hypothetical protein